MILKLSWPQWWKNSVQGDSHFSHPVSFYSQSDQRNHIIPVPTRRSDPTAGASLRFPSPRPVSLAWGFIREPFNYLLKEIPKGESSLSTNTVFSLKFDEASFFPLLCLISSLKPPSAWPSPSIFNPSFPVFKSGLCRCVFAVRETSAGTVNHLYSPIGISHPLWWSLCMPWWKEENTQTS